MAQIFTGKVISTKMQKTVIVSVERKFRHTLYMKTIVRHKKYKVHNDGTDLQIGDMVKIVASRPISKEKHFIVLEKIKK